LNCPGACEEGEGRGGRREKGEGKREKKGERREKGEGRRERGEGRGCQREEWREERRENHHYPPSLWVELKAFPKEVQRVELSWGA
jgi:hypothetical protein